jgi:hypothetical protein
VADMNEVYRRDDQVQHHDQRGSSAAGEVHCRGVIAIALNTRSGLAIKLSSIDFPLPGGPITATSRREQSAC